METVVDSKQEPLPIPSVVMLSLKNTTGSKYSDQARLLAVVKEMTMETADVVQVGNSVFLAHKGKKANKNKTENGVNKFEVDLKLLLKLKLF